MMSTTYKLLGKVTLASHQSSIGFSNIPQTYTDLVLLGSIRTPVTNSGNGVHNINLSINNSTSNISTRVLRGLNTTVTNDAGFNFIGDVPNAEATSSTYGNLQIYIPNYTSTSNKAFLANVVSVSNLTTAGAKDRSNSAVAGIWTTSSSLNAISVISSSAGTLAIGSTLYLYGVTRFGAPEFSSESTFGIQATGGNVTISGGYKYHVFSTSGTFNVTKNGFAEVLVVAGGGAGGNTVAGGGGAGGVTYSHTLLQPGNYVAIVGGGGAISAPDGLTGNGSSFSSTTATAGGFGGGYSNRAGSTGGSGGGGGGGETGTNALGGSGTSGQGNSGGTGRAVSATFSGGGGGGAGAAGQNSPDVSGGAGGNGIAYWGATYAGGGSGGTNNSSPRSGGTGGGGTGGGLNLAGSAGTANTGGGGGGGGNGSAIAGNAGGSGIVIVRYPVS